MTFDSNGTSPLVQPVQYVALSSGASLLGFEAETLWQQALSAATNQLAELLTLAERDSLLGDVFGRAGTDAAVFEANRQSLLAAIGGEGLQIAVELRSDGELNGALAAYAAVGHTGSERIYVNADKITSGVFDLQLLTAALLEEFGAAMDRRLNGGADSPGDEGQLFAAQLTGVVLSAAERALIDAEDDTAVLTIEGVQVGVEKDDITAVSSLTFSSDTGNSSTDLITNVADQNISATITVNNNGSNAIDLYYSIGSTGSRTNISSYLFTNANGTGGVSNLGGSSNRTIYLVNAPITLTAGTNSIFFWNRSSGSNSPSISSGSSFSYTLDATAPTISSVAITGTDSNLAVGEKITVTVNTSEIVNVVTTGGNPTFSIVVGGSTKSASYVSGSGSQALVFEYIIAAGDTDSAGGITALANALALNSGSISDAVGNSLNTATTAISAGANSIAVDGNPPTATLTAATISNSSNATVQSSETGTAYLVNSSVSVTNIASITGAASDQWNSVSITAANTNTQLAATGLASGTYNLYTVDAAGNLSAASTNSVTIDSTAPTVSSVEITSATGVQNSRLNAGDVVSVTVTMSEAVTVSGGAPTITLVVGSTNRTATYASGSGSSALVFNYTIQAGETDTNGIAITANTLAVGSGVTIRDAAGNNATLTHSAVAANASYLVDTTAATVTDAAISIANASGVGTSQVLQNGDVLTAIWDPTGNSDVATVTVDFSAFGGSATAAASLQSSGFYSGKYTASYTIGTSFPAGTNRNVAFTVVDTAGNSATTSDSSNATINNNPLLQNQTLSLPFGSVANGVVVVDVNDAETGSDQSIAGQALTFSITAGNSNGAFAIDPATGSIAVADATKISAATYSLTVQATDGTTTSSATVGITYVNSAATQTGTASADTLTGTALDDLLEAAAGNDVISAAAGNDQIEGGTGADTMTGGAGQDSFYNPIADQSISFSGSGSTLSIAGFDSVTDFSLGSGTASGDVLKITSNGVSPFIPVNQTAVDGTNSASGYTMSNGSLVALHSITNGIATFSTSTTFSAVAIGSLRNVAAVVNYLSRNDLGPAGTTVAFTTSSFAANGFTGVRTFVYTQTSDQSAPGTTANSFALVELRGVTSTSLTTNASAALSGALIITSNLNPFLSTASTPSLSGINEDVVDAANTGTTIGTIVGSSAIVDLDSSVNQAIALTEVDSRNGSWQYKLSSGSSWTTVASDLSPVKALLLDSGDCLRFVPATNYNGSATFNFKAWDKSIGSAGTYASTAAVQSGLFAEVFDYSTTAATLTSSITPGVPSPNGSTGASALGTLVTRRVDNQINIIDNQTYGPAYANDNATFAVRWTGQVLANQSSITFFTNSDDGVRLWVNGTSVINNWTDHSEVTDSGTVTGLTAGQWYDIQMDYYQNQGNTIAKLAWGDINTIIPSSNLRTVVTGFSGNIDSASITVSAVNDAMTGSVTISNTTNATRGTTTAQQGDVLQAANTLADADGLGTISYQWLRAGSAISGATGSSYTLTQADVGSAITVRASQTDGGGTTESATSSATNSIVNVNDAMTGSVTILNFTSPLVRGTSAAQQGDVLQGIPLLADADGLGTISYQWLRGGSAISGATGSSYTLTQADVGSTITVRASQTDGGGTTETATSSATNSIVNVNDAPTITSGASASFAENGTGTVYTATASDPDASTTLTYSIAGTDAAVFNINSSTGAVTFKSAPNFEAPTDAGANNVYDFTVSASDGTLSSAAQAVAVTVTNVAESAPVLSSVTINLTEGETKTLAASNFVVSDLEGTTNFTFTVSSVAAGIFQLASNPGQAITTFTTSQLSAGEVQFAQNGGEAPPSYFATASNGSGTSNILPVVAVMLNLNDAPVVVAANLTVAEGQTVTISSANFNVTDSDNTSFTYTVSGVSNGRFQLSSNPGQAISSFSTAQLTAGLVQFAHDGNEAAPAYSVQVSDGSLSSNTVAATISYTTINDAAVVTAGNSIGYTENGSPAVISGSITVSDSDSANLSGATVAISSGFSAGDLLSFSNQNGISGSYNAATGVLSLSGTASVANYQAALRSVGFSSSSDNPTANSTSRSISWVVNDGGAVNNLSAPAFSSISLTSVNDAPGASSSTITIAEDGSYSFTAANFGFSDLEGNSLSSVIITSLPAGGSLQLNGVAVTQNQVIAAASIGGLVFSPAANANGSGYASIGFRLQDNGGTANGGSDTSAAAAISFNVTPVNDAPVITSGNGATAAFSVAENSTVVTTVTASDIDSTGLTYSISGGADQAKFSINATSGVLSFVAAPDYENPADAGGDNTYDVIVNVGDGSLSASQAIAVAVTNLIDTPNEVPTLTINTPISGGYLNAAEQLGPLVLSGTITGLTTGASVAVGLAGFTYSAAVTGNTWSLSVPSADLQGLNQGTISVSANGSDLAGNTASASASFIKDTINPTVSINGSIAGDGYLSASEATTSLTISGSSSGIAAGRLISLAVGSSTFTATVQANGSWSQTLSSSQLQSLSDGTITITANGSDAAGNAASEASTSLVKDTSTPTISLNQPISDGYLNLSELAVPLGLGGSVTNANGQTVTVTLVAGGTTQATLTTIASAGAWSLDVPIGALSNLPQGTISVRAAVSNAAGTAASPATASFIKDTEGPSITITTPIGGDGYVNKNETNAALAISGTTSGASNGRPVSVVVGGVSYATTVSNNSWSVSVSSTALKALSDGTIAVTASVSDEAGNTGSQASSFILDTVAPATAPTVNASTTDPATLAVLSGTATVPTGGALSVTVNGATYSPVSVSGGIWSLNLATATRSSGNLGSFLDGTSYTVTATVTDQAGNGTNGTGSLVVLSPTPNTPTVNAITTLLDANGRPSSPISGGVQLRSGEKLTVTVSNGTTSAVYDNVQPTGSGTTWSINLGTATPTSGSLPGFVLGNAYNIVATVTSANGLLTATDTSSGELTIGTPSNLGTLSAAVTANGGEDNGADGTISATPTIFTFTRTPASGVLAANLPQLIASYSLGGDCVLGTDYAAPAGYNPTTNRGTVTFAAGATTATLTVGLYNNSIVNGARSLNAYLIKPDSYTLSTVYSAGALPTDNDVAAAAPVILPVVSINSTSLVEDTAGTSKSATLTVSLSQSYSQNVTVNWTTTSSPGGSLPNATATAGTDYVAASGTLTILAGTTSNSLNITINGDSTLEADENFYVQLTTATNATLSSTASTGTVTIQNNDSSGKLIDNSTSTTAVTLSGTNFNDTIIGGSANDVITGGLGNDVLRGGLGADQLNGGTGNDTFEYSSFAQSTRGSNQDTIVQFDLARQGVQGDRIKLNTLPGSLTNAGAITATTLNAAIASLYVDKNRSLTGNQAIASGDAVIFSHRATGALAASTYLMVASSNSATNSSSDLFMRIGSFVGTGLTTGVLTTSNFFTT